MEEITQPIAPGMFEMPPAAPPTLEERITGLVTDPAPALAQIAERVDWVPAAVMLLAGYAIYTLPLAYHVAVNQAHLFQSVTEQTGSQPPPPGLQLFFGRFAPVWGAMTAFGSVLSVPWMVAGTWFTRTGLLYLLGRGLMSGSSRSFFRLFAGVGWAWLPVFLQNVLIGLAFMLSPAALHFFVPLPHATSGIQPQSQFELSYSSMRMWILQFATPFVWWNWYLCALAVEASLAIPRRRAAVVVALQVVLQGGLAALGYVWTSSWTHLMQQVPGGR